ncbi:putative Ig domain-containing protein, partial [Nitrospira lenta]|uniref:putative Ig domain-containing protein n=1 Tax=Nitrospira lenta TaxID=1436998 RepID=UPI0011B3FABD
GPGSYPITFSVTDGIVTTSEVVTITVAEVNVAPVWGMITDKMVNEGSLLTFTAAATDADVPAQFVTYSLAAGAPAGAAIDATTGVFSWTPTEAQGPNVYTLTVNATDGIVTVGQAFTITVNEVNVAPVLNAIGSKTVNELTELRFTVSGSDSDAPAQPLVYSASGLPAGASFNVATREFVWTPTESQGPGSYLITFSVTDGIVTTSEVVTITVTEVN